MTLGKRDIRCGVGFAGAPLRETTGSRARVFVAGRLNLTNAPGIGVGLVLAAAFWAGVALLWSLLS